MRQLVKFNPTAGGKTPNFCLANVCAGFGIENKYASAWEAWEHTEQHTDPIPDGLDIPVFFSYTATIDGVNQNWGHIGVRLASGQFWSDGNIYDSIDAYLVNHWPKYVGWGESVNDFKIIERGNDMYPNNGDLVNFHNNTGWPGHELNDADVAYWTTGTGNPAWANGADAVWKDLMYQVTEYVLNNPNVITKEVAVPVPTPVAPVTPEPVVTPPVTPPVPTPEVLPQPTPPKKGGLFALLKKIFIG